MITDKSYYNYLLTISGKNTDQADDVSFKLSNSDTILINSEYLDNITLYPRLRINSGDVSNIVPSSDVNKVILSYSYYDNLNILKTENLELNYNSVLDLSDIILEKKYIKLSVIFSYKSYILSQSFELYFLNSSLYNNIFSNENYSIPKYVDINTGKIVEEQSGCLLITNQYDVIVEDDGNYIADIVPNTKVRMGNLTGIHNYTFGLNQPRGYGLYGESVYLTGNFYLNNGRSLVDIDKDILLANGNIKEIQRLINSLDSSIKATIEANSIITEANYIGAISNNNNSILRLGQDYSLWALGNAGIVLQNPNAVFNDTGEVDPSTIGDGDESILLQGNKINFATNPTKEINGEVYYEILCTTSNPSGWSYNNNIYIPKDINGNLITFSVGYIKNTLAGDFNTIERLSGQSSKEYLKYVVYNTNEVYIFNSYRSILNEETNSEYVVIDSNGNALYPNQTIYYVLRVKTAGMFKNGKFNSDFIETENIVAVEQGYKNSNFDPSLPIDESTNYPTIDNTKPFAVISGTTGKITTQGVNLKEATIGNSSEKHIHLTDNQGIQEDNDSDPGIYIKNNSNIVAKFCGDNSQNPNEIFNTNGLQTITGIGLNGSSSVNFNKTYTRSLTFCSDSNFTSYSNNKIRSGFRIGGNNVVNNLILFQPYLSSTTDIAKYSIYSNSSWSGWQNLDLNTNGKYRTSLSSGPYQKVRIAVPVDSSTSDGLTKYGVHITRGSIESESEFQNINIDNSQYHVREFSIKGDENNYTAIKINYPYFSDDNFQTQFFDDAPYDNDICEVRYNSYDGNNTIYEQNLESITIDSKKSKIIYLESANIVCTAFSIIGLRNYVDENNSEITSNVTTLPEIFDEHVSIIAEFYYKQGNIEKVLFKRECSIQNIKNYISDNEFSKYYIETNILKNSSGNDRFYNSFELNSPVVIYNGSNESKTYNIKLRIKFEFNGNRRLTFYQWIKNDNSADYHTPQSEICDQDAQRCVSYDAIITAGGTVPKPTDDFYTWSPSKSPYQYEFNGSVNIGEYQLKIQDNTFETLIQANGIGTGFNKFNNLGLFYDKNSLSNPKFIFDLKSNKNGFIFNKDGMFNIINNSEIPRYVPILQGNILTTLLNDNVYRYNFSGISLINGNGDDVIYSSVEGFKYDSYPLGKIIELDNLLWKLNNISPTTSSSVSYSNKHDIYLIRADQGKLILAFGEKWNDIFNDYFSPNQFFIYLFGRNTKMCIPILISVNNNGNSLTLLNGNSVEKYLNNKYWIQINIIQFSNSSKPTTSLLQDGDLSISIHYTPNTV